MYSRDYKENTYTLEASGGLMNGSLVMQDRETDSYWSIMSGKVEAGKLKGTELKELPVGHKMQWKDWKALHPHTKVLSVNGKEDAPQAYKSYFQSEKGYRGIEATDNRLQTKTPVYAFELEQHRYAVPFETIVGGKEFRIGHRNIFIYRSEGAELFESTVAYQTSGKGFEFKNGNWIALDSGCVFDPISKNFDAKDAECPARMQGFDTYWYTWSLTNPDTKLLEE